MVPGDVFWFESTNTWLQVVDFLYEVEVGWDLTHEDQEAGGIPVRISWAFGKVAPSLVFEMVEENA